jgi:hypothetical protein
VNECACMHNSERDGPGTEGERGREGGRISNGSGRNATGCLREDKVSFLVRHVVLRVCMYGLS